MNIDTHFVQHVIYGLIPPVTQAADQMEQAAIAYLSPLLSASAVVLVGGMGIAAAWGAASWAQARNALFVCAAIVSALWSAGAYDNAVGGLALALPSEIGAAIGLGGQGADITTGLAFDNVLNQSLAAGTVIWQNIPTISFAGLAMMIATILYFFGTIVTVGAAALIYVASVILLTLLVKIGPLFLFTAIWPQTRFAAVGFLKTTAGCVVTQILIVATLTMFTLAEQQFVPTIIAQAQVAGPNTVELILSLLELGFLLFVTFTITKQAAGLASGIVGGAYQSMASVAGIATSAPGAAYKTAKAVATKGASMGGSVTSSINERRVTPMIQREIGG